MFKRSKIRRNSFLRKRANGDDPGRESAHVSKSSPFFFLEMAPDLFVIALSLEAFALFLFKDTVFAFLPTAGTDLKRLGLLSAISADLSGSAWLLPEAGSSESTGIFSPELETDAGFTRKKEKNGFDFRFLSSFFCPR